MKFDSEKSLGQVLHDAVAKGLSSEEIAQAVISEFLRRNWEPVAVVRQSENGSIWIDWGKDKDLSKRIGMKLYTTPQPLLSAEECQNV